MIRMCGRMSKFKNKLLTESKQPKQPEQPKQPKQPKQPENSLFNAVFWSFGYSQMDQERYSKACKWAGCMVRCLRIEISPLPKHLDHSFR